jgi:hypothetical protein
LALHLSRVRSSDLLGRISSHLDPSPLGLENVQQWASLDGTRYGELEQFFVQQSTSQAFCVSDLEASAIEQRIRELLAIPGTWSDPPRFLIPS